MLQTRFGEGSVRLDKSDFLGGNNWEPQNRLEIAQADIVVCAIGPNFSHSSAHPDMALKVDYVTKELSLARSLGKPIIPVIVGPSDDTESLLDHLPSALAWLAPIHIVDCRHTNLGTSALITSITEISGDLSSTKTTKYFKAYPWGQAFLTLCRSIRHPMAVGAMALRQTHNQIGLAVRQYTISLIVSAAGIGSEHFDPLLPLINRAMLTLAVLAAFVFMLSYFSKANLSLTSLSTFSLQVISSLSLISSIVVFLFSLILGEYDFTRLLALFQSYDTNNFALDYLMLQLGEISTTSPATLYGVIAIACLGAALSWWCIGGYGKSLALALHWNWKPLLLLIMSGALVAHGLVGLTLTSRVAQDEIPVKYYCSKDFIGWSDAIRGSPYCEATGKLKISNSEVRLHLDRLSINNRTSNAKSFHIYFDLVAYTKGSFQVLDPRIVSAVHDLGRIEPGNTTTYEDITLAARISDILQPGLTGLALTLSDGETARPLNDQDEGTRTLAWR